MNKPEKHLDDSGTAALRPAAWAAVIAIGVVSVILLLKKFGVF
jgi:hypothetical protein